MKINQFWSILALCLIIFFQLSYRSQGQEQFTLSGELKMWHKITLDFEGPNTSEGDEYNPFKNYRLNVRFTHSESGETFLVPGYYAADGNAGKTSADSGNVWRVNFTPNQTGTWSFVVDFRKGRWVAVSDKTDTGVSGEFMDGLEGNFTVESSDKTGKDFRSKGRLSYVGERYLRFEGSGEYFLKQGPDSPENFLAYSDFDGTFHNDGHKDNLVKSWAAHVQDWNEGDPVWKDEKGKAIIGALNYLAEKGLNSVSFLTNNIAGDDQNVFPYTDYNSYDRIDVSKTDQWEIVFSHAQQSGIFLHFKMLEVENQGLLDGGGVGFYTKLYFRELIARFGHHLALNWNLCEESGEWFKDHPTPPQNSIQRRAMAEYFSSHDPYNQHLVIHNGIPFDDLLGPEYAITGPSVQTSQEDFSLVHSKVLYWLRKSREAGKQWAVAVDEPGDARHSLVPDKDNPDHDMARRNALWGTFMAGGWGNEWYFGYDHEHSDLTCQDYRSRDLFWDQASIAMEFFNSLPFWEMENHNELVTNAEDKNTVYAFAKPGELYVIYLNSVKMTTLDLREDTGKYEILWFNPKTGGELVTSKQKVIKAGKIVDLGPSPDSDQQDWVILVRRGK